MEKRPLGFAFAPDCTVLKDEPAKETPAQLRGKAVLVGGEDEKLTKVEMLEVNSSVATLDKEGAKLHSLCVAEQAPLTQGPPAMA